LAVRVCGRPRQALRRRRCHPTCEESEGFLRPGVSCGRLHLFFPCEHWSIDAAQKDRALLVDTLPDIADRASTRLGRTLATQLSGWSRNGGLDIDPAIALTAVLTWSRLHGFVSLEIAGNFKSMGIDPDPHIEIELSTFVSSSRRALTRRDAGLLHGRSRPCARCLEVVR
jgi:hypothetical protein